jgi:palmitoyl transferase
MSFRQQLLAIVTIFLSITAFAEDAATESMWSRAKDTVAKTWQSEDYELYVPLYTWHNRHFYSDKQIDSYNEYPLGLGVGKYRFDEDGDWHALYAMAFLDSHNDVEPFAGYGFEKIWRPTGDFRIGAGYTVGFTMRQNENYVPMPAILPVASIEYRRLSVQSTYVPGFNGNGNILFTWFRWQTK